MLADDFRSFVLKEDLVNGRRTERPVVTINASIWYYKYQLAALNAAAAVPCAKLVWILRNPIPHARSLYFHLLTDSPRKLTGASSAIAMLI